MIFKTGEQDKYNYIFPSPREQEFFEDKSYTLKCIYKTDDLVEFYNECKGGNDDIRFDKNVMLERDEYTLKVDETGISISSSCEDGAFRAVTSLRQLVRQGNGTVICCDIHDKPAFRMRGLMWDISRKRKPKKEHIKEIIDLIAGLKYNEFQLYMEDLCFKYDSYPHLTADYDCLTPEDIHELDEYCKERFIELVPNQNSMGHLSEWLKHDEFKHLQVTPDTIDFLNPESLEVIDNIYSSLLPHFSSDRVHIGFDEVYGLGKNQTEAACKERGKAAVFMEWLNKIKDLCENKYGKKVIIWGDMLKNHPESIDMLPDGVTPVIWGYEDITSQYMETRCISIKDRVDKYYVCPSSNTYEDFTGRWDTTMGNIRSWAELGEAHNAYGYLLSHWTNPDGPSNSVWGFLPMALAGQYSWNTGIKQQTGWRKPHFTNNAEKYLDEYMFGGAKVSRWLRDLANYYLLEPERVAVSTICNGLFYLPVSEPVKIDFFDCRELGDTWYFEDVIRYMNRGIDAVSKLDMDDTYKREIIVNSKMVIAGAELAIAKHDGGFTKKKAKEVTKLFDWIIKEHSEVWLIRNYEKGLEDFVKVMTDRRNEIKDFIK